MGSDGSGGSGGSGGSWDGNTADVQIMDAPSWVFSAVAFVDTNRDGVRDGGEGGLAGVSVTLLDATGGTAGTAMTGSDGTYSITGLASGTYTAQYTAPTGYVLDGDASSWSESVTIGSLPIELDVSAYSSSSASSVSGVVWVDADGDGAQGSGENGLSGVTVTLLTASGGAGVDASGGTVSPVTTGSGGSYSFTNLTPGSYTVQFCGSLELPVGGFGTGDVVGHGGNARAQRFAQRWRVPAGHTFGRGVCGCQRQRSQGHR